jgi:hypothetical protein
LRIWEFTFSELTQGKTPLGDQDGEEFLPPFVPQSIVPITENPRFATAMIKGGGSLANQALLELVDGQWTCIGGYLDDTILISKSARGCGVAEELVLRCAEHREGLPFTSNFTNKGYSLLRRTHRLAVSRAIKAGLDVPERVIADYPELTH